MGVINSTTSVRAEPVEALTFSLTQQKERPFDRLRANVLGVFLGD